MDLEKATLLLKESNAGMGKKQRCFHAESTLL